MLVLALDSSLAACSAALYDSGQGVLRAMRWSAMDRGHAEALPLMIEGVARDAEIRMANIGKITVTMGPGSFTGVRIGLAMARGLALSLSLPIVGLTTLRALFLNVADNLDGRPVAAVIDAGREEYYLALFSVDGEELIAPTAIRHREILGALPEGGVLVGTGADLLLASPEAATKRLRRSAASDLPDAALFVPFAARLAPGSSAPQPLYLRAHYAKPRAPAVSPAG